MAMFDGLDVLPLPKAVPPKPVRAMPMEAIIAAQKLYGPNQPSGAKPPPGGPAGPGVAGAGDMSGAWGKPNG
jgi:hypothetical protein